MMADQNRSDQLHGGRVTADGNPALATASRATRMTTIETNNFKRMIAEAMARGEIATAERIEMERKIVSAIVMHAIANHMTVSVYDGEEWMLVRSKSYGDIFASLFITDEDRLLLRNADGDKVGWFCLVYGKDGYNVVSDYTANHACEAIFQNVIRPLTDKLGMRA
ncbi:hypothetical protein PY650_23770 [Rhizobium calliandrae]|uniref:Uncharacterized protein n=1 Tax=Rhizobium calliandrae TaxID=1312182 RepID=A0ABT7KJ05_9HYPH|nr:hypothetical protein [Rhizobium calliandrae]MDL2408609.1 hypothetical protein [Rhizobium calliandrae]